MERYKTRERAQKPVKVMLIDPATGEETSDWMEVRSSLSDEFIEARDAAMQNISEVGAEPNKEARKKLVREHQLAMKASLVAGWGGPGFDGVPCTREKIVELLREAPQLQSMVTHVADDGARFFGKPSSVSGSGLPKK